MCPVGLDGKLSTIAVGGGTECSAAWASSAIRSAPGISGTWRIAAPAMMKP
jgi:hypothetical protein